MYIIAAITIITVTIVAFIFWKYPCPSSGIITKKTHLDSNTQDLNKDLWIITIKDQNGYEADVELSPDNWSTYNVGDFFHPEQIHNQDEYLEDED